MTTTEYAALFPIVSPTPYRLIHVLVHCATNLYGPTGKEPSSCVIVYNTSDKGKTAREGSSYANCTATVPGRFPHWNEMIYNIVPENQAQNEDIKIMIQDETSKKVLLQVSIPWHWLTPFHQYHMKFSSEQKADRPQMSLYVSFMVKLSSLSMEGQRSYYGLEVYLNAFEYPLENSHQIYTVLRFVTDLEKYKRFSSRGANQKDFGIRFKSVKLERQDFAVSQGHDNDSARVSLASDRAQMIFWNHDFVFSRPIELDKILSDRDVYLVFEYHTFDSPSKKIAWDIGGLLGWSAILFDQRTRDEILSNFPNAGFRTKGFRVIHQGLLDSEKSSDQSVRVFLRILGEHQPTKTLMATKLDRLPVLPSYHQEGPDRPGYRPIYETIDDFQEEPPPTRQRPVPPVVPHVEPRTVPIPVQPRAPPQQPQWVAPQPYEHVRYDVVPSYPYENQVPNALPPPPPVVTTGPRFRVPRINPYDLDDIPTEYRAMLVTSYPPTREDDIDGWFDYFQREIAMYKLAIRRMVQDISQLRNQQKTLTDANADLRKRTDKFDQKTKVLTEILEADKIDKVKIQEIFNRLQARISSQAYQIKEDEIRIANYEKELSRRSEVRQQYESLLHTSQGRDTELKLMKQRLDKAQGLEETVRRQEMVIERLEAMINNYVKEKRLKGAFNDMDRALLSEHARIGPMRQSYRVRKTSQLYFCFESI